MPPYKKGNIMKIIITIETEEQKQKILEVLENMELEGVLEFGFDVRVENS
jgi:hypothetical protein